MPRRNPPPTENMIQIMAVLADGEAKDWREIQLAFPLHGAVLQSVLKRMVERGLLVCCGEHGELYRKA